MEVWHPEVKFYEVKPSTAPTKPPARLVGTFTLGTNGVLTFTAGSVLPPQIATTSRAGAVTTISLPTLLGWNYRLLYNDQWAGPISTWLPLDTFTVGTGATQSLYDTNSGPARFYVIERFP